MMIEKCHGTAGDETPVSLGYDKVRFLGPGLHRRHARRSPTPSSRSIRPSGAPHSEIKVVNQKGELVGVARHILAWVKDKA